MGTVSEALGKTANQCRQVQKTQIYFRKLLKRGIGDCAGAENYWMLSLKEPKERTSVKNMWRPH